MDIQPKVATMKYGRIGSNGTKTKGKNGAGIFFTDGNSVLLLKRSDVGDHPDTWGLPGGTAKQGETAIGTAIRETKEETGLSNIPGHRVESLDTKNGRQKFTVFIYRIKDHFDVDLSNEHTDWEWVDLGGLQGKNLHPKLKENMERYLRIVRRKVSNTFEEWVAFTESVTLM